MDYQKIYDRLMLAAASRTEKLVIFENHHVLPKSCGGDNSADNVVELSLREHFIAHKLLVKIYKNKNTVAHKKMIYALWFMCKNNKMRHVNSRDYENARILFSKNNPNKCKKRKEKFKKNHKAGKYKYDYDIIAASLKSTLSKFTKDQMNERLNNSIRKCDRVARGKAIQKGKASLLKMIKNGKVTKFWSYEATEKVGIDYRKIYYIIKNKNGVGRRG